MGNSLPTKPCCLAPPPDPPITLIIHNGTKRRLSGHNPCVAGEVMFEFPTCMVCHADSFFIGQRVPALGAHDELARGHTYFVLPADDPRMAACSVVSASTLAGLSPGPGPKPGPDMFGPHSPFRYVKGPDGRLLIKVAPEFIERIIVGGGEEESRVCGEGLICSTPELQKRYDRVVVRCRENVWAPKLETISECRSIGLRVADSLGWSGSRSRRGS